MCGDGSATLGGRELMQQVGLSILRELLLLW